MDSYAVEGRTVFAVRHSEETGGVTLGLPQRLEKGRNTMRFFELDRAAKLALAAMLMNGENGKPSKLQRKAAAAERKKKFGDSRDFRRETQRRESGMKELMIEAIRRREEGFSDEPDHNTLEREESERLDQVEEERELAREEVGI